MIDLHSHILPGIDDGPRSLEESIEIARAAADDGTSVIAATPHVRDDYPTAAQTIELSVRELNFALEERAVPLSVVRGAEIALSRLSVIDESALRRFALGGDTRYVLLEFPYYGWPLTLEGEVWRLKNLGITPVLAHPERNGEVQSDPGRMRALVEAGALLQLTAASVDGRLGRDTSRCARELVAAGNAHLIASDAHKADVRAVGLRRAATAIEDRALARWLTHDVPAAIIEDAPIPERPHAQPTAPKRRRRLRFGALRLRGMRARD